MNVILLMDMMDRTLLRRRLRWVAITALAMTPLATARSQDSSTTSVLRAVNSMFAAMAARDTTALRALLAPDLVLVATVPTSAGVGSRHVTVSDFIQNVAKSPQTLRERMWNPTVLVDGAVATVWTPYDFHRGDTFSHCGHDAFTLERSSRGWIVTALAYTVQQTGCDAVVDTTGAAAAIRRQRAAFNAAIAKRDTMAIARTLHADYSLLSSRGAREHGRNEARHRWAELFRADSLQRYVRTPREVRVNGAWGMAEELGDWNGQLTVAGALAHVGGTYAAKWLRDTGGSWLLQSEVFTLLRCDGPPESCASPPAPDR